MILDNSPLHKLLYEWLLQSNNDYFNTDDAADYLLSHGATIQHWISVKDRLPEIDIDDPKPVPVLVYEYGYICVGQYGARSKYFDHFAKEFYVDGEASTGVTHWMPLPSPPEEETNG